MNDDIANAVKVLKEGGIILYPTDTIWGLGCDATNEIAVNRIFEIKQRKDEKSLLVLLDNENKLQDYIDEVPEIAWNILEVSDKPLTIIYPSARNLASNILANDGSIGIRITKDEFCRKMIYSFGKPVISTSANISGERWPANFKEIDPRIINAVDYVIKYRQSDNKPGKPSGIIKLGVNGEVKVIRE